MVMTTVIHTEQDYKGDKMKNLILILILFSVELFAQVTAPSAYTTNYGFRKWVQGANPSSDSINANWDELDASIKLAYDSAQAKGSKLSANTWTGAQTFNGATGFNATMTVNNIVPETDGAYYIGYGAKRFDGIYANYFNAGNIYIYNSEKNDSALISLDDSTISFNKSVSFTATELTPSTFAKIGNDTTAFQTAFIDTIISGESYLSLQGKQGGVEFADAYGIGNPSTRSITAASTSIDVGGISYVMLSESEAVTGLATLTAGASIREGAILTIVNGSNYNVTLKNGTGNMILGADLVLAQYDVATFVYYDIGGASYRWLCISNRAN